MNQLKMFGLAALAALMAMAFVGASSAMAEGTSLCSADESTCASGNIITHVHETSVGKAKLLSSLPTIECTALFLGDTLSGTDAPLVINGKFTYSSCNNFCTVTEVSGTEAKVEVLKTASELGAVTGEGEVHVSCPFINCTYNGEGLEGHALGPLTSSSENGNVNISGQETNKVSGSCPETAFLDITTTPLVKTYIALPPMSCVEIRTGESDHFLAVSGNECKEEDAVLQTKDPNVPARAHIYRLIG